MIELLKVMDKVWASMTYTLDCQTDQRKKNKGVNCTQNSDVSPIIERPTFLVYFIGGSMNQNLSRTRSDLVNPKDWKWEAQKGARRRRRRRTFIWKRRSERAAPCGPLAALMKMFAVPAISSSCCRGSWATTCLGDMLRTKTESLETDLSDSLFFC